jgi:hypothetical protein
LECPAALKNEHGTLKQWKSLVAMSARSVTTTYALGKYDDSCNYADLFIYVFTFSIFLRRILKTLCDECFCTFLVKENGERWGQTGEYHD